MRYLIIVLTAVAIQIDLPQEVPFDSFEGWSPSRGLHESRFWVIPDLESIHRLNQSGHVHVDGDIRLIEAHFLSPEGHLEMYVVSEMYNEEPAPIFFGLFTVTQEGGMTDKGTEGQFLALYTRDGVKEVWEKMPEEIEWGSNEEFAEYMHEKLGRYIVYH